MKKINMKKISAFLAALVIGGTTLTPALANPFNESRIEKYILTEEEQKDPNYSYMINDEVEMNYSDEDVALYNKIVRGIMNRESYIHLTDDEEYNTNMCYAIYHSPYTAALDTVYYDPENKDIGFIYYFDDKNEQDEMFKYVENEMDRIFDSLFTEDMNLTDKLIMLFGYGANNFKYCMSYPKQYLTEDGRILKIPLEYLLKKDAGVCHTYAYFLDYFCQKEGVESHLVTGQIGRTAHMWNMIKLEDDKYYFFDITTAIQRGKLLKQIFVGFGLTKDEYDMYDYSIPKEYRTGKLKEKTTVSTFKEMRDISEYEYLGNHIFKFTSRFGDVTYYNTETRERSTDLESVKVKQLSK